MAFQRKSRPLDAPPLTTDEALLKLEHFCAYRERCPQEVRQKMKELRLNHALTEQLYEVLEEDGFFNERRFTEMYVIGKFRSNNWGRIRIRQELKMRNIAPELIETAMEQIDETTYIDLISALLRKKYKQYDGDPQARQKAAAAVIRGGFESDLVFKMLKSLDKNE